MLGNMPVDDDATTAPDVDRRRSVKLHVLLFVVTCATTYLAGALGDEHSPANGLAFAGTLMTILVCHEMGHYVVARRHGIDASLPYFIPLPPMVSLGTMGAVIRMRQPITDRNQLIDVGAAGPLAGLAVAVPLLVVGLHLSPVGPPAAGSEAVVIEGNSIAYAAIKWVVFGRLLPTPEGIDVQLHPMALAAWVGILITMINLIPIGQLDGGHIACGFLGDDHERLSRWLHSIMLVVGVGVVAMLVADARTSGLAWGAAVKYGAWAGLPWFVWAAMLLGMRRLSGGVYHPPVSGVPLTRGRRVLAAVMAIVFLVIFTPVPFRQALP
jgi:membrane-associated protease RseP (regulator of RpoE activity)